MLSEQKPITKNSTTRELSFPPLDKHTLNYYVT
jgi:hypothetical protein